LSGNGDSNTAIGAEGLKNLSSGSRNISIGFAAGRNTAIGGSNTTANGSIYIGTDSKSSASSQSNEIVVGTDAVGLGSNTAVIGATTQTSATIYGLLNSPSGISAAGGVTLAGNLSGTTAAFSRLVTFNQGISAANGVTLNNVSLTGTPTAPTASVGTNTTQIATTAFVQNEIIADTVTSFNGLTGAVGGVCAAVANTFTALQSFTQGISAAGGVTFAGSLSGTTAAFSRLVTFNQGISAANGVTLHNANLTGIPTAPTASVGTNTTQVATTAFVLANGSTNVVTSFNGRTGAVQGVSAMNGLTGAVRFTGGQGITNANGSGNSIVPGINYRFSGLTFFGDPDPLPLFDYNISIATNKDYLLLQAHPDNPYIENLTGVTNCMYLTNLFSLKDWILNGGIAPFSGGSGGLFLRGVTFGGLVDFYRSVFFYYPANFLSGFSADGTITLNGTVTGRTASFSSVVTLSGGLSAAGGVTLASPSLTGTPTSTTAAIGTNTTQIATTAFVQNEIVADTVTSFNGRTGSVQGVSAAVAGDGITVSGATGSVTITNAGVTRAVAGTGISVNANTGTVTITNSGVTSLAAGTGVAVSASTGAVTVTNIGVQSFNGATGAVTGASLGANTFTGLQTSATGFSGPLTGNATSATTATNSTQLGGVAAASYALLASPTFTGTPASTTAAVGTNTTQIATTAFVQNEIVADTVTAFNGRTGSVQGVSAAVAGSGISVSAATGSVTISNTGVLSFNGNTGAVTGASLGANTFTGLQTSATGFSGPLTGNATSATNSTQLGGVAAANYARIDTANTFTGLQTSATGFSGPLTGNATTATTATNSTQLGGVAAASYALLASPTFTGTPASTTAAVGTNTTQIATTAFVNNEIIADAVTAFNGRTGSVQGVSAAVAGDGITVSGATGSVTITNAGVTRAVAGTGISVNANTGTVTITNSGVLSFNGNAGAVQGVSAAVAGDGITVSGATGSVTITNAGVTRAVAGTGISVNANTGTVTITNSGVTSLAAGTGVAVSASTGAVTVTNIGVQSFNGATGAVTGASLGANTFTGLQTSATGFSGPLTGNATSATTATNSTQLGGTAAASWAQLAAANTFTALNTFNSGIKSNLYEPLSGGATVTIGLLSGGGQGNVNILSSEMRIGGTGTLQGVTLTTATGVTMSIRPRHNLIVSTTSGNIDVSPFGTVTIKPQVPVGSGGSMPTLLVQNTDTGSGQVRISGGDLYLGTRDNGVSESSSNIIFGNPNNAFTTTLTAPNTASSDKLITLPNATGTVALDAAANTFTALQSFTQGISAAGGVTLASNIAVNGGSITTSATTGNVFNTTATTLNIGGAATTTNIATVASGLTLNIGTGANGSDIKNIYIGTGPVGGGSARTTVGYAGGLIVSHGNGITLSDNSGGYFVNIRSATTNITGTLNASGSLNSTGLFTTSGGLSASGGVTFNSTINSAGYALTPSAITQLTGTTYTFLSGDNGKVITHNNASGCTFTVPSGLPVGFSTTVIQLGSTSGVVKFVPASGVTLNSYGGFVVMGGQHSSASLISYSSNIYNLSGNLI
jgi:hypothetical protein